MVGVDLSPKSIEVAKKKLVYDELLVSSILSYLTIAISSDETIKGNDDTLENIKNYSSFFDLVVMGDVVNYLGENLDTILAKIAPLLSSQISPKFKEIPANVEEELASMESQNSLVKSLFDKDSTTHPLATKNIGGLITFTVDELQLSDIENVEEAKNGFILKNNGIFVYTKAYIDKILEKNNYLVESCRKVSYRVDRGIPVAGYIYVCRQKRTSFVL